MPGPGKKPASLKLVAGTARKDREPESLVEFEVVSSVPSAPDWLPNAHAVKEFERLAPILHANKLLTEAGVQALAHLCALHGKIVQLYAAGEAPVASMVSQYRGLISDFGLTPVAQGKVRPSGDTEKPEGRFSGIGKRPSAKS